MLLLTVVVADGLKYITIKCKVVKLKLNASLKVKIVLKIKNEMFTSKKISYVVCRPFGVSFTTGFSTLSAVQVGVSIPPVEESNQYLNHTCKLCLPHCDMGIILYFLVFGL